ESETFPLHVTGIEFSQALAMFLRCLAMQTKHDAPVRQGRRQGTNASNEFRAPARVSQDSRIIPRRRTQRRLSVRACRTAVRQVARPQHEGRLFSIAGI